MGAVSWFFTRCVGLMSACAEGSVQGSDSLGQAAAGNRSCGSPATDLRNHLQEFKTAPHRPALLLDLSLQPSRALALPLELLIWHGACAIERPQQTVASKGHVF